MTKVHDHEATLRRTLAAFERGDIDAAVALYEEDATVVEYLDPTAEHSGHAAIEALLRGLAELIPDAKLDVGDVLVDGDRLAAEVVLRGTPSDQTEPIEVRYGVFQAFRDGKIQAERVYASPQRSEL